MFAVWIVNILSRTFSNFSFSSEWIFLIKYIPRDLWWIWCCSYSTMIENIIVIVIKQSLESQIFNHFPHFLDWFIYMITYTTIGTLITKKIKASHLWDKSLNLFPIDHLNVTKRIKCQTHIIKIMYNNL